MKKPSISFDPAVASPLVRVFASNLRAAILDAGLAAKALRARGRLGLRSRHSMHALTLSFMPDCIELTNGLHRHCAIVVTTDFDKPDDSPDITGLFRHPLFALNVLPLLNVRAKTWQAYADNYWQAVVLKRELGRTMPAGLNITCTSDGQSLTLGENSDGIELIGSTAVLQKVLSGQTLLISELIAGGIKFRGEIHHVAKLSEVCQYLMLDAPAESLNNTH